MKKKTLDYSFNYNILGKSHIINVYRTKTRYWRLSVGSYNRQWDSYDINFSSPRKLTQNEVTKIIDSHARWIESQLTKKEKMLVLKDGEAMLHGEIVSTTEFSERFEKEIKNIITRYYYFADLAGVEGVSLKFRKMKSRWGSYNKAKKVITLNKWLVILPNELIDYVICHELTHHYVFNHSKEFYNQLAKLYPDYLVARKAIKKYSDIV